MARFFLFLLALGLYSSAQAQTFNRDSLRTVIASSQNDTTIVRAMRHLAYDLALHSPDSTDFSLALIQQAIEKAEAEDIVSQAMYAFYDRAYIHYIQGALNKSATDYRAAIRLAVELNLPDDQFAFEDGLATILFEQGEKEEAIELKYKVIDYYRQQHDTFNYLRSNSVLAHLYLYNEEFEKAREVLHHTIGYQYDYPGMIENYGNLGLIHSKKGQLDSAIYYMELANKMGVDYPHFIFNNQIALAEVYRKKGDHKKALQLLEQLHVSYTAAEDKYLYNLKMLLAQYYVETGQLDLASRFFQEAEAGLLSDDLATQKKRWFIGYQIHERTGDYEEALSYYKTYHMVSDSLNEVRRDSAYQVIESKYQVAKKEDALQAQQLKNRNLWMISLAVGALLSIGILIFYFRGENANYKATMLKEKSRSQELEIVGLRREHQFIALQSIVEGQEEERRRIAQDLHDNISSMMAAIRLKMLSIQANHEQLDQMLGQVSDEVRRISHNMTPLAFGLAGLRGALEDLFQLLRSKGVKVHAETQALEQIQNKERAIMLYRIFQEMANNILKHAQATEIRIITVQQENDLFIQVADDGVGMSAEVWQNSPNLGLKSIKSRVKYLNGTIKMDNSTGTCFLLNLPINEL